MMYYIVAIFLCTGTAVLEFNYTGEAREKIRTPSFWKQKRRAARFATSSSLFSTYYLVVISSDFKTDFLRYAHCSASLVNNVDETIILL